VGKFLWNLQARIYPWLKEVPGLNFFPYQERQALSNLIKQISPSYFTKVLDLGVGPGNYLALFPTKPKVVCGLDYSLKMLKIVQKKLPQIFLINGSLCLLPLKKRSFSLVLCIGVSEYIKNKEKLIQDIASLLTTPGMAIFSVSKKNLLNYLRTSLGHHLFLCSPEYQEKLFTQHHLIIKAQQSTTLQIQYLLQKTD